MKLIDNKDREIGKYYAIFRKADGVFKSISVYKYESIFGDITERIHNSYIWGVETTEGMTAPIMDHAEAIQYELDEDEIFRQVTMELVTQNL